MDTNRVAVVTGGTRGIGADISLALAKAGHTVFAVYRSNEEGAKKTEALLKEVSPKSEIIKGDMSLSQDVKRIADHIGEAAGRIDILINNAGIFDFVFLDEMSEDFFDNMMNVNFKSQMLMMQAVLPYMKKQNYGRIVNASSISSSFADVGLIAYACSKASVDMLTKISAAELAPWNITVNAYAPGITHTDMTDAMIRERGEEQAKQIALKRFGTGEEVASLVAFLASETASYVTGEVIGCDGGFFKVQNPYRAHEHKAEQE